MQPTYFPWAGYFNLIMMVDNFVFLDDVQLERRSWQLRNRIICNKQEKYIILPIAKQARDTKINETVFADNICLEQEKTFKTIKESYINTPYGKQLLQDIEHFFLDKSLFQKPLSEYNIEIIVFLCNKLDIKVNFYRSSNFKFIAKRSDYLIKILKELGCSNYLSPRGSLGYLEEDRFIEKSSINLLSQNFEPGEYKQPKVQHFISHLSIIDVIANLGYKGAAKYCYHGKVN